MHAMTTTARPESNGTVLAAGLVVVLFGGFTIWVAYELGYVASLFIAVVYLLIAWRIRTSSQARALRLLVGGFGVVAFALGMFGLLI